MLRIRYYNQDELEALNRIAGKCVKITKYKEEFLKLHKNINAEFDDLIKFYGVHAQVTKGTYVTRCLSGMINSRIIGFSLLWRSFTVLKKDPRYAISLRVSDDFRAQGSILRGNLLIYGEEISIDHRLREIFAIACGRKLNELIDNGKVDGEKYDLSR